MSDTGDSAAPATDGSAPQFTERELQMLGWAMQSLKSGPPEIDYVKLASFAGMSNPRSASNAWAKVRNKLMAGSDGAAPATPKAKGSAKKKGAKSDPADDNTNGEAEVAPKKTPRKRAATKAEGEGSPKKKGRGKAKKGSEDESTTVKSEGSGDSQDLEPNADAAKSENAETLVEEHIMDEV